MASLFGKNKLKDLVRSIETKDILQHVKSVERWRDDYHSGTLRRDTETSREQSYNNDFFKEILGYREKPGFPFTLIPKAVTASGQIADAALGSFDLLNESWNYSAVVELKGALANLDRPQRGAGSLSPVQQGFKYKYQYKHAVPFVIVSNFWEFRLYNDNQIDFERWTLDDLVDPSDDYRKFKGWYGLLHSDRFTAHAGKSQTEQLLSDVRIEQEEIGKEFYAKYQDARESLISEIKQFNPNLDDNREVVVAKAQKILDRIVFAAFAEDKGLLPDNVLQRLRRAVDASGTGLSLWGSLKDFFDAIDIGNVAMGIPEGYNGGLFAPDMELNGLRLGYDALGKVVGLGTYNFREDLSVNVLGHIFEQSISDLEAIRKRELDQDSQAADRKRRKRDGIFYTPEYIVRYIVENALGAHLREQEQKCKNDAGLHGDLAEDEYTRREHNAYSRYLEVLKSVTVVDPACGSGAFLVHVLDYLLTEHRRVSSVLETNGSFDVVAVQEHILHYNIYGVDLNDESVEIAKLSLWLKTATRGKKLTDLNDNLKVGNSLIDDPDVAGDKAFNWQEQFPEVFAQGGFDVVVMNPPYVQLSKVASTTPEEQDYLPSRYGTSGGRLNTFIFFIHLLDEILSVSGRASYIVPNTLLTQQYYRDTRRMLMERLPVQQIVLYPHMPFADAVVENVTVTVGRSLSEPIAVLNHTEEKIEQQRPIKTKRVESPNYSFNVNSNEVVDSIDDLGFQHLSEFVNINQGIALKGDRSQSIHTDPNVGDHKLIDGRHINRYSLEWAGQYLEYIPERIHSGGRKGPHSSPEKLLFRRVSDHLVFTYDTEQYFALNTLVLVTPKSDQDVSLRALLLLLNSRLLNFYYVSKFKSTKKVFSEIQARTVGMLPVPDISSQSTSLEMLADKRLDVEKNFNTTELRAQNLTTGVLALDRWPSRMNRWWKLSFAEFLAAMSAKPNLKQSETVLEIFEKYRDELAALDNEIQRLDREIDQLVYQLYELTTEEIALVEASV